MKPDLESIYSQLDLHPSCSLEEFQRAYRKRISELPPDRQDGAVRSPDPQALLRNLIWVYATVNRFHRRYGRMPGGYPTNERRALSSMAIPPNRPYIPSDEGEVGGEDGRRSTLTLAVLFIALLILVASWSWSESGGSRRARSNLAPADEPVAMVTWSAANSTAAGAIGTSPARG